MSLETLLRDAADGDVTFQPDDVQSRVRRWQRRRRALAGLGVLVLLAAGAVGVLALTGDDGERSIVTGPPEGEPQPIPITEEALVGSRWIETATLGDLNPIGIPLNSRSSLLWAEFHPGGEWVGGGYCGPESTWEVRNGAPRLVAHGVDYQVACFGRYVFEGHPALYDDGRLVYTARSGRRERQELAVTFRRLDEMAIPEVDELVDQWQIKGNQLPYSGQGDEIVTVYWREDRIDVTGCEIFWSLAAGVVQGTDRYCDLAGTLSPFLDALEAGAAVYTEGSDLFLSSPTEVVRLTPPQLADPQQLVADALGALDLELQFIEEFEGPEAGTAYFTWQDHSLILRIAPEFRTGREPNFIEDVEEVAGGRAVLGDTIDGGPTLVLFTCDEWAVVIANDSEAMPTEMYDEITTALIDVLPCDAAAPDGTNN